MTQPTSSVAPPPAPQQLPPSQRGPAPATGQPPARRPARWLPFVLAGLAVTGIALAAAVVLIVSSGGSTEVRAQSPDAPADAARRAAAAPDPRQMLGLYQDERLIAAVPATWRRDASAGEARFADPDHPGVTLTIRTRSAGGGLSGGARREADALTGASVRRVAFPGGREAYRVTGTAGGGAKQVSYLFDECGRRTSVTGVAPAASFADHARRFSVVASLTHGNC